MIYNREFLAKDKLQVHNSDITREGDLSWKLVPYYEVFGYVAWGGGPFEKEKATNSPG